MHELMHSPKIHRSGNDGVEGSSLAKTWAGISVASSNPSRLLKLESAFASDLLALDIRQGMLRSPRS